ncbi:MAG: hypothetical protein J6T01_03710 [Kiritimatiellae bacterium]|nr:hypothetical protein [Kiritimatiellia bacterium]
MSAGGDLVSLVSGLAVAAGVAAVFPVEAVRFRASPPPESGSASFVELGEEAEVAAVRAAKATWRNGGGRQSYELLTGNLPEAPNQPVLGIWARSKPPPPPLMTCEMPPFAPSLAAPPPVRIKDDGAGENLPFSRAELLKAD